MKRVEELLPWKTTPFPIRPFDGMWAFNPSIHFDGLTWRCVLRCADYAMPGGVTVRSRTARPAATLTRNALAVLDPRTWEPTSVSEIHELDGLPRAQCANIGYEDIRLFCTVSGGLQGVAASLHLARDPIPGGGPAPQVPEQVLLSLNAQYDVVTARPLRGDNWRGVPQKNWVPFDGTDVPYFLQAISRGTIVSPDGAARVTAPAVPEHAVHEQTEPPPPVSAPPPPVKPPARGTRDHRISAKAVPTMLTRGRRLALDAASTRASAARRVERSGGLPITRALPLRYAGLRGGSQLHAVGPDVWLGIAHEMKFVEGRKYYWHSWYLVDATGRTMAVSSPMKLAEEGIEFAAGMAIDGDQLVVSYGVDDMECRIGETSLAAVMAILAPPPI